MSFLFIKLIMDKYKKDINDTLGIKNPQNTNKSYTCL